VIIAEGEGHYPRGPRDPNPMIDFITQKAN